MTLSSNPPVDLPIEQLTVAQKWELFQALWIDLDVDAETQGEVPSWHLELLAEREQRLASGEAKLLPLEDFLEEMRKTMP
ncbi:Putative addiction module component [Prosthecobacter debontii]|uniref:Putative addiction module component n=2 Tax=Prosthecobacter debontii TaxID=48467 RepID=A0A1T4YAG2_9BACT|nr:Putative addiction module component [Prosthecobacter debontii]